MSKDDKDRGLYEKFIVKRSDGRSEPGEKHYGCVYFVLDVTHDPYAIPAIRAYAEACKNEYPELSKDLRTAMNTHPCGCRSVDECFHWVPQTPDEAMAETMSENDDFKEPTR